MIEKSGYNFFKVLCVLVNQWVYCMMSLAGGEVRCVSLLYKPGKAERSLRGRSRAAATSNMECFVIIVNG